MVRGRSLVSGTSVAICSQDILSSSSNVSCVSCCWHRKLKQSHKETTRRTNLTLIVENYWESEVDTSKLQRVGGKLVE